MSFFNESPMVVGSGRLGGPATTVLAEDCSDVTPVSIGVVGRDRRGDGGCERAGDD